MPSSKHQRLGHDQPAREVEVLPHALGKYLQPVEEHDHPLEHVAGQLARLHERAAHHDARGAIGLVLRLHRLERQRDQSANLGRGRDDVL